MKTSLDIKLFLRSELSKVDIKAHQRLPSDEELVKKFKVNRLTLRKVLQQLVQEGVIYRKERQGTFKAPPLRVGQILIVTPTWWDERLSLFLKGLTETLTQKHENFLVTLLSENDFKVNCSQIEFLYRDLACVLFFHSIDSLEISKPFLTQKAIPFLFYGSDFFKSRIEDCHAFWISEKKIVELAFTWLCRQKNKNWACVYNSGHLVTELRFQYLKQFMKEKKIDLMPDLSLDTKGDMKYYSTGSSSMRSIKFLKQVISQNAALFATTDHDAFRLIQIFQQEPGFEKSRLPKLIGVDALSFGSYLAAPLTSVMIPSFQDGQRSCEALLAILRDNNSQLNLESSLTIHQP